MADPRQLIREFTDAVFNEHRLDAVDTYATRNFVDHDPPQGYQGTLEGFKQWTGEFLAAFPDCRCEIDDVIAEGDKAVARSRLIGTNTGPFMGMPATGKTIEVEGIDIVRVENGRMAEHWGVYDAASMMQQLGMMPAAA